MASKRFITDCATSEVAAASTVGVAGATRARFLPAQLNTRGPIVVVLCLAAVGQEGVRTGCAGVIVAVEGQQIAAECSVYSLERCWLGVPGGQPNTQSCYLVLINMTTQVGHTSIARPVIKLLGT